jgi:hypothetical protein
LVYPKIRLFVDFSQVKELDLANGK